MASSTRTSTSTEARLSIQTQRTSLFFKSNVCIFHKNNFSGDPSPVTAANQKRPQPAFTQQNPRSKNTGRHQCLITPPEQHLCPQTSTVRATWTPNTRAEHRPFFPYGGPGGTTRAWGVEYAIGPQLNWHNTVPPCHWTAVKGKGATVCCCI